MTFFVFPADRSVTREISQGTSLILVFIRIVSEMACDFQNAQFRGRFLGRSIYELNRDHPKLQVKTELSTFVLAM